MLIQIPDVGDTIKILKPWTFRVQNERRNKTLIDVFSSDKPEGNVGRTTIISNVTLPPEIILTVDRVYIRKNANAFSSITFKIKEFPGVKKQIRFWAKLNDVNRMDGEVYLKSDVLNDLTIPHIGLWKYDSEPRNPIQENLFHLKEGGFAYSYYSRDINYKGKNILKINYENIHTVELTSAWYGGHTRTWRTIAYDVIIKDNETEEIVVRVRNEGTYNSTNDVRKAIKEYVVKKYKDE